MTDYTNATTDRLRKLLGGLASRTPIQQAIIALESGDRSFRWVGAAGETDSDGTPVREETPFFLASIDKLFNATVAMLLNESGRLDLDVPIATYLPSTVTHGLHQFGGMDYSESITVRHLLSHTSGLADWLEDYPKGRPCLIDRLLDMGDMTFTIENVAAVVREQLKPHFPPQDPFSKRPKVRYSDTNYMLLIGIIEALTGEPLHQVQEQMLFKPLDLRHTYFPGYSQPMDPTPKPMILRANGRPLHIPLFIRSVRGMYSTIADTLTFLRKLMRNEVFQKPGTLASMQKHWHRFGFPLDRAALRSPSWPVEYGLGIMRFRLPRFFTLMRPLPPVLGHTGSTGCWLFYCPKWDMLLAGSVDEVTAGAVPYRIIPKILNILRSSDGDPSKR